MKHLILPMTDCGSLLLSGSDARLRRLGWMDRQGIWGLVAPARMPVGAIGCDPLEAERRLGAHAQGTARGPDGVGRVPCRDHGPGRGGYEKGKPAGSEELVGITVELSWTTAGGEPRGAPGAKPVPAPELTLGMTEGVVTEVMSWPLQSSAQTASRPSQSADGNWHLGARQRGARACPARGERRADLWCAVERTRCGFRCSRSWNDLSTLRPSPR